MSIGEDRKRKLGRIRTLIYGRTAIIMVAFLAQLGMLAVGYYWLRGYNFVFYWLFVTITVIAIVHVFNTGENPDMKLSWMFPIAVFPVFGAIFYLAIILQPGTKVLYGRQREMSARTKKYVCPDRAVWEKLRADSPQMGQLAHYLYSCDNSPVYEHSTVTYYALGDEQFPHMVEELKKAEDYIFMEFFIVSPGYVWDTLLEILLEKVKEGVEVRFLYDGTCVLWYLPSYYPLLLEQEGIQCRMFSPIKPIFSPHYNNRDHRKIVVIDGKVAFTGGINLSDEYINRKPRFGHWKDAGVMVKGEAVERFAYMFLEMWNMSEGSAPKKRKGSSVDAGGTGREPSGTALVHAARQQGEEDYGKYRRARENALPGDGYVIPYSVCPLGPERVGERVYLDIIHTAHTYVHIMTPYLILDYQMLMALRYAARRGVEVVIIMPHIPDKKYAFLLAKTYYNQLLEAGVRICEYEPGFVHAKVFVSDDCKAVVGTVNLDYRSLYHHFECGLVLYQNSQVALIERDVQDTLSKCLEVIPQDYGRLHLWERALGRIMRIVAPLM